MWQMKVERVGELLEAAVIGFGIVWVGWWLAADWLPILA